MLLTQKNMWETVLGLVKRDGEAQRRVDAIETKHRVLQCRANTLTQDAEADTMRIASLEREVKALSQFKPEEFVRSYDKDEPSLGALLLLRKMAELERRVEALAPIREVTDG